MRMPGPDLPKQIVPIGLRVISTCALVLAMLTACADSSGPAASSAIVEGEPLRLEVPSAALHIPAGALSEGVDVRLSKKPWDQLNESLDTGEVPITEVVTIEFSKAEHISGILVVEIDLPDAADGDLYGLIKSTGSRFPHGIIDTDWSLALGVLDEERAVLRFQLGATATSFSLVVVRDPDTSSSIAAPPVTSMSAVTNRLGRFATNVLGGEQAHAQAKNADWVTPLNGVGWAFECRPGRFTGKWRGQCNSDSEDFNRMAKLALASSQTLIGLGFERAYLRRWSQTEIENRRKRGRRVVMVDPTFPLSFSKEYFLIEVDPKFDRGREIPANAEYAHDRGTIIVKPEVKGRTIIHEIMHAVQAVEIPIVGWSHRWITEGIASATEPYAPDRKGIVPIISDYRFKKKWRDWHYPLSSEDFAAAPYQVSEFWISIDSSLMYLSAAYPVIQSGTTSLIQTIGAPKLSEFPTNLQYAVVDHALRKALGKSIKEGYLDLLKTRDGQERYQGFCHDVQMDCDEEKCRLSAEAELGQEEAKLPTEAMSAQCYNVSTEYAACPYPSIDLDLEGDERAHRFLVNGDRYNVDDTADPKDKKFKLWVANVDVKATPNLSAPDVIVRARCGQAKLLGINQSIATYAMVQGAKRADLETEQYLRQYDWSLLGGHSEWTTLTRNGQAVKVQEEPLKSPNELDLTHRVTLSKGISAYAQFTTTTTNDDGEFVIDGRVRIEANGSGDGSYGFSATADATLVFSVSVPTPSIVEITNCDLFDQDLLADYGSEKDGNDCSFRTAGSQTMHLPSGAGLPEIPEDFLRSGLEKMDDVGEEDSVGVSDEVLKQVKKLKTAQSGKIFFFSMNANRIEAFFGNQGREVNESFTFRISPDEEEERPPRNYENENISKKDRGTPLKALAKHLPIHGNSPG